MASANMAINAAKAYRGNKKKKSGVLSLSRMAGEEGKSKSVEGGWRMNSDKAGIKRQPEKYQRK